MGWLLYQRERNSVQRDVGEGAPGSHSPGTVSLHIVMPRRADKTFGKAPDTLYICAMPSRLFHELPLGIPLLAAGDPAPLERHFVAERVCLDGDIGAHDGGHGGLLEGDGGAVG